MITTINEFKKYLSERAYNKALRDRPYDVIKLHPDYNMLVQLAKDNESNPEKLKTLLIDWFAKNEKWLAQTIFCSDDEDYIYCDHAADMLHQIFTDAGLEHSLQVGVVNGQSHAWARINDIIFDPTSSQLSDTELSTYEGAEDLSTHHYEKGSKIIPIPQKNFLWENLDSTIMYHGSTDANMAGKQGIHIGTKLAATQALEARIGVPAEGEWDGTREYGKTLLAGKKSLETKPENKWKATGFNAGRDVPEEDYYPTQRSERATYSDKTEIPMDCKPIVFPVKIVGRMSNSKYSPHSDSTANGLIMRGLRKGNAKSGFYYTNIAEDEGSISAVVPDGSFLQVL